VKSENRMPPPSARAAFPVRSSPHDAESPTQIDECRIVVVLSIVGRSWTPPSALPARRRRLYPRRAARTAAASLRFRRA
jgi:hypothetical protein